MSVSLERLETLRDERLADLDRYRERRNAHEKILKRLRIIRAVMLTLLISAFIIDGLLLNIPAMMFLLGSTTVFYLTWHTLIIARTEHVNNLRTIELEALDEAVQRIAYVEERKLMALVNPEEYERLEAQAAKIEYEQSAEYNEEIRRKAEEAKLRKAERDYQLWKKHADNLSKAFGRASDIADQVTLIHEIEEHNTKMPDRLARDPKVIEAALKLKETLDAKRQPGLVNIVTRAENEEFKVQYWPMT